MIGTSAISTARILMAAIKNIGDEVPAEVMASYERANRATQAARDLISSDGELVTAILEAIDNGADPTNSAAVQALVTRKSIGTDWMAQQIQERTYSDLSEVIVTNADSMVASWREHFDAATKVIATASKSIGKFDLKDTQAILARGGNSAEQWTAAVKAVETIDNITSAWHTLKQATPWSTLNNRYRVLTYAAPTYEEWNEHDLSGSKIGPWELHQLGVKLYLADLSDPTTWVANYDQYRVKAQREAQDNSWSTFGRAKVLR